MNPYAAFHCQTLPDNYREHIVRMKRALRARIGDVQSLFAEVSAFIEQEIASIDAQGGQAWPQLDYAQIAAGRVSAEQRAAIHRRGCVVVRGHFARDRVSAWDQDLLGYLARNDFERVYRGPVDRFFGNLEASRPQILPIYWSRAQMQLRQHERMARVQVFLNRLWKSESQGRQWFDPQVNALYPDRVRRRPPAAGHLFQGPGPAHRFRRPGTLAAPGLPEGLRQPLP